MRSHRRPDVTEGRTARTAHFVEGSGRLTRRPIPPSTPPPFRKQTASGMPSGILCILRRVQDGHHSDSTLRIVRVCRAFRGRMRTHTMLPRRPTLSLSKYYIGGQKSITNPVPRCFFGTFPGEYVKAWGLPGGRRSPCGPAAASRDLSGGRPPADALAGIRSQSSGAPEYGGVVRLERPQRDCGLSFLAKRQRSSYRSKMRNIITQNRRGGRWR